MKRATRLVVEWDDHGDTDEPDWAYHLRMGDLDADQVTVMPERSPEFLDGATGIVLTDTSRQAFSFTVDYEGVADMQAGDGISKEQAAVWLRQVADQLTGGAS